MCVRFLPQRPVVQDLQQVPLLQQKVQICFDNVKVMLDALLPTNRVFKLFHNVAVEDIYLPFIPTGSIRNANLIQLPETDDGTSDGITLPLFPFGYSNQSTVYVRSQPCFFYSDTYHHYHLLHRWAPMDCCHLALHTTVGPTSLFREVHLFHLAILWLHSGMMWTSEEAMDRSSMRSMSQGTSWIRLTHSCSLRGHLHFWELG